MRGRVVLVESCEMERWSELMGLREVVFPGCPWRAVVDG